EQDLLLRDGSRGDSTGRDVRAQRLHVDHGGVWTDQEEGPRAATRRTKWATQKLRSSIHNSPGEQRGSTWSSKARSWAWASAHGTTSTTSPVSASSTTKD